MSEWTAFDEHNENHREAPDGCCAYCVEDAPECERCGRPEGDWPDFHLGEDDLCSECRAAEGMQHHEMFVVRAKWWAKGGHCLCRECAPPRC